MNHLKINDKIELLINDNLITGKITQISTRETEVEFTTFYHINLDDGNWSVSISHNEYKSTKE